MIIPGWRAKRRAGKSPIHLLRLTDLEPQFLRYEPRDGHIYYPYVDKIEEAQGIEFLCPKCFEANGRSNVGVHAVICWSKSRGVPDDADPKPGRWQLVGMGYSNLSLTAEPGKSSSVLLLGGCAWHGFVTNGAVT